MTAFNWVDFLKKWSLVIIASPDSEHFDLPADAVKAEWLGFDGASEAQIAAAEQRLEVTLPSSYREFLKASNGWRHTGNFIQRILPVEEIHWMKDTPFNDLTETVDIWLSTMPDDLPPDDDGVDYRHLRDALVISAATDEAEVFLLNPKVIAPDGEWQAWAFAHWIPGIEPYPSFRELLEAEFRTVSDANQQEAQRIPVDASPQKLASGLAAIIKKFEEKAAFHRAGAEMPINADMAAGFQEVIDRLRPLQSADPSTLRESLLALAQELDEKYAHIVEEQRHIHGYDDLLKSIAQIKGPQDALYHPSLAKMMAFSLATARASSYVQAAGIIRYFVK